MLVASCNGLSLVTSFSQDSSFCPIPSNTTALLSDVIGPELLTANIDQENPYDMLGILQSSLDTAMYLFPTMTIYK